MADDQKAEEEARLRNTSGAQVCEIWHGTINGYTYHECRCSRCRKAWNGYRWRQRHQKRTGTSEARRLELRATRIEVTPDHFAPWTLADFECPHGRLETDPNPRCGCYR